MTPSSILVTGGAGFIGANFIRHWLARESSSVVVLDKLTYAGNRANLQPLDREPRHEFVRGDIADGRAVAALLDRVAPIAIVNFAAETHVDRSIRDPVAFVETNVLGTVRLLEATRHYWERLRPDTRVRFRFVHVSTDEVFGSLEAGAPAFTEGSPYAPNSPYAASKAGADHLVRAFHRTYALPTITMNCSNNYGPYQFPEKLIPLMILNALSGRKLPVYGSGGNVRDWMAVSDTCEAIRLCLARGKPGETYNIGADQQHANIDVVRGLCRLLDELRPAADGRPYEGRIEFVDDRPGHDRRYAVDASRAARELGWRPTQNFATGLRETVQWYLDNPDWIRAVASDAYSEWMDAQYGRRGTA